MPGKQKPVILITGASGMIGSALCRALKEEYRVAGLDIHPCREADFAYSCDLTSGDAVALALHKISGTYGRHIAAVIHLAAYFDFSGQDNPLYRSVNVEGTRNLLRSLQDFEVERFIYSGTMLVHEPVVPGRKIDENTPLGPRWVYPRSKAEAEKVIREEHGKIPYTILRLAGLYDEKTAVPTLSSQIARIYEHDFKSRLYAGDLAAGQAFIHKDDMVEVFIRAVRRRNDLPEENVILAGEDEVMGYQELQNRIGELVYGKDEWKTIVVPECIAKPGAWLESKAEPLVPDAFDQGEKPFIKPFMIDLASDHYDLDIGRAKELLGWEPKRHIYEGLKDLVENLKKDPAGWYEKNGITAPDWVRVADQKKKNPDRIRHAHEQQCRREHYNFLWAHFLNIGLAFWLISAPPVLGYESQAMIWSDMVSGLSLLVFSFLSLSRRFGFARYLSGATGFWLLAAPLVFWAPTAQAYLNDTLTGMLAIGLALLVRPLPGISPAAAQTGPTVPPGWDFSPSSWFQRLPIIILAFAGFFISRYLCAYQLGHIDGVWEPFFAGAPQDPKNGTEEIITSSVSEAWPVPDAGLGAMTYALEILTGIMGSSRRWRTMPWLVMLFGFMIVPLGAVSIFFIIIQPVWLGTWCTLCLIAAAAMLLQIPYSLDELVATGAFLWRRKKQGRPLLRIFFTGDTDEGPWREAEDDFEQPPSVIVREMVQGGVGLTWNLVLCVLIGIWLMFTRLTLGAEGGMADADHLVGALVITIAVTAFAETARPARFLIIPLGAALFATPFLYGAGAAASAASMACGMALILLSLRRGPIRSRYGTWDRLIV